MVKNNCKVEHWEGDNESKGSREDNREEEAKRMRMRLVEARRATGLWKYRMFQGSSLKVT